MIRPTLRTRLTIWFAASVILILAPFLAGVLVLQWRSMRAALDHHLQEDAETAAEMLVPSGDGFAWRVSEATDPGYDAGLQRWVEVYEDGRLLFVRGYPRRDEIRRSLPTPSLADTGYRTIQTPAGAYVRMQSGVHTIGNRRVLLRVARSEDELRSDLRLLGLIFGLGAPLAVLAASIAGYVISGRALRPLARMAARARSISADDLSQRLPVESVSDELGQLAVVFNDTFSRLEQSFERLKRFTADASHQLRTPLTAIRSVGEVGLRQAKTPAELGEVIGSMLEEVDRLSRLVDRLLLLSRWESGRVPLTPVPLDLADLARHVANYLSVLAEERGIAVELDLPVPMHAQCDLEMLRAALTNVIDNAIKYAPDGGRVRLSGWAEPAHCCLSIEDSGPGIPVDQRERVLERFHRADSPAMTAGTGLGLAISNWVVRAHHGELRIDASDLGGARVIIWLPRSAPPSPPGGAAGGPGVAA